MKNKGFTLIELLIVVIILGILAAVAIPYFSDFKSASNIAKMKGFASALNSSIALATGKWRVAGSPDAGITLDDGNVILFKNGYPSTATVGNLVNNTKNSIYVMTGNSGTAFCNIDTTGNTSCGSAPPQTGPAFLKTSFKYCGFIYYPPTVSGGNYTIDTQLFNGYELSVIF